MYSVHPPEPYRPIFHFLRKKVINIDKSGANKQAIRTYNKRTCSKIKIRQCKYLNNRVEGEHRFIKWRTQNMLGFKNFESASRTLIGIEIVRMIKKEQIAVPMATSYTTFISLAILLAA